MLTDGTFVNSIDQLIVQLLTDGQYNSHTAESFANQKESVKNREYKKDCAHYKLDAFGIKGLDL